MSPAAITSELRKNTRMSPSVLAAGTCTSWMPSPLKYIVFSLWKNVSVGQAPNGVGGWFPVGALIALSTFSCATTNAWGTTPSTAR